MAYEMACVSIVLGVPHTSSHLTLLCDTVHPQDKFLSQTKILKIIVKKNKIKIKIIVKEA